MLRFVLDFFAWIWQNILSVMSTSSSDETTPSLQVYIKTNIGEQVSVCLDPAWTVGRIKADLAPRLNSSSEELRIIFAGKELPDDLSIGLCDLGNRSLLHAVRIASTSFEDSFSATAVAPDSSRVSEQEFLEEQKRNPETSDASEEEGLCRICANELNTTVPGPGSYKVAEVCSKACPGRPPGQGPRLLCDESMVLTIQLSEDEQRHLQEIKAIDKEGVRPHFFVYCAQPCESVRIGKLRVRCQMCHQGALTVHQDPCSWDDVLVPKKIAATCASPGCGLTHAEFFFKCREHETSGEDDTAVPLYLVRANLPGIPCLACTDISSPIVVFQCSSGHVMCLDCFVTYCVSRLNERQFVYSEEHGYTLPCPAGCPDSLIQEVHHFRLMGGHNYNRYQHWATEEAVLAAGGILCPYPGCGQGIIPDPECRRVVCIGGCGNVFCKDCLQGFHIGECEPTDDESSGTDTNVESFTVDPNRAAHSRWDDASNIAIKVLTKPCPKCRTPTERDGGCMHMVCTRSSCGFNWCWVCQTEWTRDCMGAHWFG